MASVRFLKGSTNRLPSTITEGLVYLTTDGGNLYIDSATRVQVNAKAASSLIKDGQLVDLDAIYKYINDAVAKAGGGGHVVSASPPSSSDLLWIDTIMGGVVKYYDSTSKSWKAVNSVWGTN